jgi:GTP pyrophosphokinase
MAATDSPDVVPPVERAQLAPALAGLAPEDAALIEKAAAFALPLYGAATLGTGEPTAEHGIALAVDLAKLNLDPATRAAGVLFAVPQHLDGYREKVESTFSAEVAGIVASVGKLHQLRLVTRDVASQEKGAGRAAQAEVLRKMLLAMVEDIRAVMLRLASRTQTLRWLVKGDPEVRRQFAQETLDIYAPLANRLGVWQLKWELEDLSLRFLEPETYKRIAGLLDEKRAERAAFIAETMDRLSREIAAAGIAAQISGRPKHIYSIWNKMKSKGRDFSELYDVRGLRVLVDEVRDCYTVLGIVHNLWTPIPKEFDDYISRPKANDYRSLHTAVIGPDGRALEVQIRTHEMHRQAELGVAAHWRYKEGAPAAGSSYEQKIAFLRQVLAWRDEVVDSSDWVDQFKNAALDDTVYVLTPQGRVIDLPRGATPVDFAYHLHSDVGHRCRGAKVDGAMVPLDYRLENGQRVEIVTAKVGGPSRDWLNPELGYLASNRARTKVRQYFNQIEHEQTAASGRAIVERELQREGRTGEKLEALSQRLGFDKLDEFFIAVGREEVGPRALQQAIRNEAPAAPVADEPRIGKAGSSGGGGNILVVGVGQLMTQLAKCCRPVPPDPIRGFVTRGRGVSIHRRDCPSLAALLAKNPERALDSDWGQATGVFPVDIFVQAHDRQGLLRDISEVLSRDRINVIGVNTLSRRGIANMQFTAEVTDAAQLARALAGVREVSGVFSAVRRS